MRVISLDQSDIEDIKPGVKPPVIDAVMEKVSGQLGETWLCAKAGATWYFAQMEDGKRIKNAVSRRRKFVQALSDATEASVAIRISL
jgi:hypothetical protein